MSLSDHSYEIEQLPITEDNNSQMKLFQLLLLRCVHHNPCHFWGTSTATNIILHVQETESNNTFVVQANLQETVQTITEQELLAEEGKFSLKRHFRKGAELKLSVAGNTHFVIATTCKVDKCAFLEKDSSGHLSFINTGANSDCLYRIGGKHCSISGSDVNHYLFGEHIHGDKLDEQIAFQVEELAKHFGLKQIEVKSIMEQFDIFVRNQVQGIQSCLTKQDVTSKLFQLFLSKYVDVDKNLKPGDFYKCPEGTSWDRISNDKLITIFDSDQTVDTCLMLPMLNERDFNKWKVLLLEAHSLQDYQNIINICTRFDWGDLIRVICVKSSFIPHSATLKDVNNVDRAMILAKHVNVQGRSGSMELGKLIDEFMYELITRRDIIHILTGTFNIGNNWEPLPSFLLKRSPLKIFFKFEMLHEIDDEHFIIQTKQSNRHKLMKALENADLTFIYIVDDGNLDIIEELKSRAEIIHRLIFHTDECLEWKESLGSTETIRKYQQLDRDCKHDSLENAESTLPTDLLNTTHSVSGSCGTGKSTFLLSIAHEAPTSTWVVKVTLNEFTRHSGDLSCSGHLEYYNNLALEEYGCTNVELAKAVFQKYLDAKKVLVLLDDFHKITRCRQDDMNEFVLDLQEDNFQTWLTTLPHMTRYLDDELGTISTSLKPFSEQDQENLLIKYFAQTKPESSRLLVQRSTRKWLELTRANLKPLERIIGIPLQTKLLGEVFSSNLEASLKEGDVYFKDKFDLFYLYEESIKIKSNASSVSLLEQYQELFASLFDGGNNSAQTNTKEQLKEFYANFTHPTFLQYLGAQWLFEIFNKDSREAKKIIKKLLKKRTNYEFLLRSFDFILAKGCPLHSAIINGQTDEALRIIKTDPCSVDQIDKGGRTVLHLVALYGICYDPQYIQSFIDLNDQMNDIVESISDSKMDLKHDFIGFTPLEYSLCANTWAVANKMCDKSKSPTINVVKVVKSHFELDKYYQYCSTLNFKPLLKTLAHNMLCFDLLHNNAQDDFLKQCYNKYYSLFDDIDAPGIATVSKLLEILNVKSPDGYYYELRLAAAIGSEDNVIQLMSEGSDVNEVDVYGNVALHYAVLHQRVNMMEILICNGADVNQPNLNGDTSLYLASERGYNEIIHKLLPKGADINKQNNNGSTPLMICHHIHSTEILLSNNADVNTQDKEGSTALHYASDEGNDDIALKLITKGADLAVQNNQGETPLFVALRSLNMSTAELLLSKGADVSIKNNDGHTGLHYAIEEGEDDIVADLIKQGIDINALDYYDITPLLCAFENENIGIVKMLLSNGADVNINAPNGHTCFHHAAEAGEIEIVVDLIKRGADVDVQNCLGATPLLYALSKNHREVADILLSNGANIHLKNEDGYSCLYYAASTGNEDLVSDFIKKGAQVNKKTKIGETPLTAALREQHISTAELLLCLGADDGGIDELGNSGLHYAALFCDDEIVLKLIAHGAYINKQNNSNQAPLLFAVRGGRANVVRLLLSKAANVNTVVNDCGYNYLHFAVELGNYDLISILIESGADMNKRSNEGFTPLILAIQYKHLEAAKLLLSKGTNISLPVKDGNYPIHYAAKYACADLIATMANITDLNITNDRGETPIHLLVLTTRAIYCDADVRDRVETAKVLLDNGANVNIQDNYGNSVLHHLSKGNQECYWYSTQRKELLQDFWEKAMELILNRDADPNLRNNQGQTALDVATIYENSAIISLIAKFNKNI